MSWLRFLACGAIALRLALATATSAAADAAVQSEYAVKAAFIFNFAKFTDFPQETTAAHDTLTLCVFAPEPYRAALAAIEGKQVQGKTLALKRNPRTEELKSCQMMFIAESESRRGAELMLALKGAPVLTIGEADGFAERGGMIGFFATGDRVQFEINNDAAQRANLKISSQLLRLARLVKDR